MNASGLSALIKECFQEVIAEGRRICAWCKKDMGSFVETGDTHGICPECAEKMTADIKKHQPPTDPRSIIRQPDPDMSHYTGNGDRT